MLEQNENTNNGPMLFIKICLDAVRQFPILIHYPQLWRLYLPYVRSLRIAMSTYSGIPWITLPAVVWLDHLLSSEMRVFEWGSGGSTIFFAKRCKELFSVEHDPGWFETVRGTLDELNLHNGRISLIEPKSIPSTEIKEINSQYLSARREYAGLSFKDYVQSIRQFDGDYSTFAYF